MILVLILAIVFGVVAGYLIDSVIIGIIAFVVALGYFSMKWNEAGATINQATQHKRDQQIIDELKKLNENKDK